MSADALLAQDEILAVLRTIPNGWDKTLKVYDGATSDQEMRTIVETQGLEPCIVVNFTGFSQVARRYKGIVGAAYNSQGMHTVVQIVADRPSNARKVWGHVNDKLLGFMPTNCGELEPVLYNSVGETSFLGSPTRFSVLQSYTCLVNSSKTL